MTHPFRARLADVIDAHTHDGRLIDRETALDALVAAVEEIINEFVQDVYRERCLTS
jgi:methyl coenzyme M reductase beta subunit